MVSEASVLAAARSDASFDGRDFDRLPRHDRDRYRERSRQAIEASDRETIEGLRRQVAHLENRLAIVDEIGKDLQRTNDALRQRVEALDELIADFGVSPELMAASDAASIGEWTIEADPDGKGEWLALNADEKIPRQPLVEREVAWMEFARFWINPGIGRRPNMTGTANIIAAKLAVNDLRRRIARQRAIPA